MDYGDASELSELSFSFTFSPISECEIPVTVVYCSLYMLTIDRIGDFYSFHAAKALAEHFRDVVTTMHFDFVNAVKGKYPEIFDKVDEKKFRENLDYACIDKINQLSTALTSWVNWGIEEGYFRS